MRPPGSTTRPRVTRNGPTGPRLLRLRRRGRSAKSSRGWANCAARRPRAGNPRRPLRNRRRTPTRRACPTNARGNDLARNRVTSRRPRFPRWGPSPRKRGAHPRKHGGPPDGRGRPRPQNADATTAIPTPRKQDAEAATEKLNTREEDERQAPRGRGERAGSAAARGPALSLFAVASSRRRRLRPSTIGPPRPPGRPPRPRDLSRAARAPRC